MKREEGVAESFPVLLAFPDKELGMLAPLCCAELHGELQATAFIVARAGSCHAAGC